MRVSVVRVRAGQGMTLNFLLEALSWQETLACLLPSLKFLVNAQYLFTCWDTVNWCPMENHHRRPVLLLVGIVFFLVYFIATVQSYGTCLRSGVDGNSYFVGHIHLQVSFWRVCWATRKKQILKKKRVMNLHSFVEQHCTNELRLEWKWMCERRLCNSKRDWCVRWVEQLYNASNLSPGGSCARGCAVRPINKMCCLVITPAVSFCDLVIHFAWPFWTWQHVLITHSSKDDVPTWYYM